MYLGIFDATNSTKARRKRVLDICRSFSNTLPVVFCESICDDVKVLEANYQTKIRLSPDYKDMDPVQVLLFIRVIFNLLERDRL